MAFLTISDRQLVATGRNGFGLLEPFSGLAHCHRLPLIATARLHKRSIPVAGISDENADPATAFSPAWG